MARADSFFEARRRAVLTIATNDAQRDLVGPVSIDVVETAQRPTYRPRTAGRDRIRLVVDDSDMARLEFLDAAGRIIQVFPRTGV